MAAKKSNVRTNNNRGSASSEIRRNKALRRTKLNDILKDEDAERPESLCVECAKYPSLKEFVKSNSITGVECGICHRRPYDYPVCSLEKRGSLANRVRALIRFYFDEWDYNSHWGGDLSTEQILSRENLIIESKQTPFHARSAKTSEGFLSTLFWPPYPPWNEGVSVYAGHQDNIRLVQGSLQNSKSRILRDLELRLTKENYFIVEGEVRSLLEKISSRISKDLDRDEVFFRARIGIRARFQDTSDLSFRPKITSQPFTAAQIGAPPPIASRAGRLNRAGVSYLYLARQKLTAIAEVRPHPGHEISVAAFRANRQMKLASFDTDIGEFSESDEQLELFHFAYEVDKAMSLPITPEEVHRYSITQLVADVVRQLGFDGVSYRSALGKGGNICIFSPESFCLMNDSPEVFRIDGLEYSVTKERSVLEPNADYWKID